MEFGLLKDGGRDMRKAFIWLLCIEIMLLCALTPVFADNSFVYRTLVDNIESFQGREIMFSGKVLNKFKSGRAYCYFIYVEGNKDNTLMVTTRDNGFEKESAVTVTGIIEGSYTYKGESGEKTLPKLTAYSIKSSVTDISNWHPFAEADVKEANTASSGSLLQSEQTDLSRVQTDASYVNGWSILGIFAIGMLCLVGLIILKVKITSAILVKQVLRKYYKAAIRGKIGKIFLYEKESDEDNLFAVIEDIVDDSAKTKFIVDAKHLEKRYMQPLTNNLLTVMHDIGVIKESKKKGIVCRITPNEFTKIQQIRKNNNHKLKNPWLADYQSKIIANDVHSEHSMLNERQKNAAPNKRGSSVTQEKPYHPNGNPVNEERIKEIRKKRKSREEQIREESEHRQQIDEYFNSAMEELKRRKDSLKEEQLLVQKEKEELERKRNEVEKKSQETQAQVQLSEAQLNEILRQREKLSRRELSITNKEHEIETARADLTSREESIKLNYEQRSAELAKKENEITQTKKKIEEDKKRLESEKAAINELDYALGLKQEEFKKLIFARNKEQQEIEAAKARLESERIRYEKQRKLLEEQQETKEQIRKEASRIKAESRKLEEEKEELQRQLEALQKERNELNKDKEIDRRERQKAADAKTKFKDYPLSNSEESDESMNLVLKNNVTKITTGIFSLAFEQIKPSDSDHPPRNYILRFQNPRENVVISDEKEIVTNKTVGSDLSSRLTFQLSVGEYDKSADYWLVIIDKTMQKIIRKISFQIDLSFNIEFDF